MSLAGRLTTDGRGLFLCSSAGLRVLNNSACLRVSLNCPYHVHILRKGEGLVNLASFRNFLQPLSCFFPELNELPDRTKCVTFPQNNLCLNQFPQRCKFYLHRNCYVSRFDVVTASKGYRNDLQAEGTFFFFNVTYFDKVSIQWYSRLCPLL